MPLIRLNPQLAVPRFDRFFENFWNDFELDAPKGQNVPKVDIEELENHFSLRIALPGLDKKDVEIAIEDGVLAISGSYENEVQNDKSRYHLREIHRGTFRRHFNLGEAIDAENIQAEMQNGILSITLAKQLPAESEKRKQIEIR